MRTITVDEQRDHIGVKVGFLYAVLTRDEAEVLLQKLRNTLRPNTSGPFMRTDRDKDEEDIAYD